MSIAYAIEVSASGASAVAESLAVRPGSSGQVTVAKGLSSVGLVTSYGNTLWYYSQDPPANNLVYYLTPATESYHSPTAYAPIPGLSFNGTAGQSYEIDFYMDYWVTSGTNSIKIGLNVSSGTSITFCLPYSPGGGGSANACVTTVGPTIVVIYTKYSGTPTDIQGRAFITIGTSGPVQVVYATSSNTVWVGADSAIMVTLLN